MLVFKKDKMMARVGDQIAEMSQEEQDDVMSLMKRIDGKEALPNRWRQTVHGENDAYYVEDSGEQIPVNLIDCEEV